MRFPNHKLRSSKKSDNNEANEDAGRRYRAKLEEPAQKLRGRTKSVIYSGLEHVRSARRIALSVPATLAKAGQTM